MTNATTSVPVPEVVAELAVHENADTNNWDTVFAIRFNDANTAISKNWASVSDKAKNVSQTSEDYSLTGVLNAWELTVGGDGKNIRMCCPFKNGTYKAGSKTYDVTGYEVIIEVGMEWVPDPDQFAFTISGNDKVTSIMTDLNKSQLDEALKSEFTAQGKTLSGKAEVHLIHDSEEWLIEDGNSNYYVFYNVDKYDDKFLHIYQFEEVWKNNLRVLEDSASQEQPAVVIITIKNNKTEGIAAAVLQELLSEWFNSNISNFNYVFSILDLSPKLSDKDNYAWIKPTGTSYAVTDNGTLANSVFGVLTMTQNHDAPASHEISPNAIPEGGDSNAGFLISGTCFMKEMMLAGARTIFDNAPESSFTITNDGLTVTNNADMVWGKFKKDDSEIFSISSSYSATLDAKTVSDDLINEFYKNYIGDNIEISMKGLSWSLNDSDGEAKYLLELKDGKIEVFNSITFKIKKNQFKMSLDNSYLEIQFIDLLYPESWEYDVHINYTEQVSLGLVDVGNGKKIFGFDQVTKDMVVSVTKTETAITVEIVEDAIVAGLALLAVVLPVIDGLRAAAQVEGVTVDAGEAVADAGGIAREMEEVPQEAQLANETAGAADGAAQAGGKWTSFKNAFTATRWKVFGGFVGVLTAGVATQDIILTIMEAVAKGEWAKVPAFDEFADMAIAPYSWPGVDGYELKLAQLAASMQVGLKTQIKQ